MKKTKPRKDYGYYCDLCNRKICKYGLDFDGNGINIGCVGEEKDICNDCAKEIAEEVVDAF